ncbi:diguanylate cyclase [Ancylobacter sp. MQZ15Z-1]|uniref:diguanylate cyclase n=1 Tax=Ancylobacter mangrovi TaxID=2972472 RepID=A0A9X2T351_9HYPH|nr:sensor domain-containing diguanylate cyclase [Ancylobacter mangrovi]MCS0496955.1 diguanylate cyclase [Ancylobacter mangrovi]
MPRGRIGTIITVLVAVASLSVVAVMVETVRMAYRDAEYRAEREGLGLLQASESYIASRLRVWDLALEMSVDLVQDPRFSSTPVADKNALLANLASKISFIGSLLVLDSNGNIVLDPLSPQPRLGNFADRDYFLAQKPRDAGLYISQPFRSRLRNNDPSIGISRRISNPDGSFGGIVLIAIRLNSIRDLFSSLDPGQRGSITLFNAAGRVLMRQPSLDGTGDTDIDLSSSSTFARMLQERSGTFTAVAITDGTERLYNFSQIPGTDLFMAVGLAWNDILSGWWFRLYMTVAFTLTLCLLALVVAIRLQRELARRERVENELAKLARTDPLTELANRRVFDESLEREWRRTKRTHKELSLLLVDSDHFKQVNDRHGHTIGDRVLKKIGDVLARHARRAGDLAVRYGGEEFAMILPDTPAEGACKLASEICQAVEEETGHMTSLSQACTVSIGVASSHAHVATASQLVKEADAALYLAKEAGRNCVKCFEPPLKGTAFPAT